MLAVERRLKVLERAAVDQAVEVSSLAREFQVSEMTIRRDLRRLERDGFVRRTYGGATTRVVRELGAFQVGPNARSLHHAEEKHQIARRAAELASGSRVMFIGIGSTIEQFARVLPANPALVVITPSLTVASLLGTRRIRVIITGGLVRQDELNCVGASAVEGVQRYNADTAVIGAAGICARPGITDLDDRESEVIRAALDHSQRIVVVADGSKFGYVGMNTVAPISRVAVIVTDASADTAEVQRVEDEGVEVIKVVVTSPASGARVGASPDGATGEANA